MAQNPATPWVVPIRSSSRSALTLYCFSFAGGSAHIFRSWATGLATDVEIMAIELPGHGRRFAETLLTDVDETTQMLCAHLAHTVKQPFVFFGHSNGALLAYELACALQAKGLPMPRLLMVSGKRPPHVPHREPAFHQLPDGELIEKLREYEGTPDAVLQDHELMDALLPILRADFKMAHDYRYTQRQPLRCGIASLGGMKDPWVPADEVELWRELTVASFAHRIFSGGHFFIYDSARAVFEFVDTMLSSLCRAVTTTAKEDVRDVIVD